MIEPEPAKDELQKTRRLTASDKLGLAVGALFLLVIGVHHLASREVDPVERHLQVIETLVNRPTKPADYFKWSYVTWIRQGRRSPAEVSRVRGEHLNDLEMLGFLKRQTFHLKNVRLDYTSMTTLWAIRDRHLPPNSLHKNLGRLSRLDAWTLNVIVPASELHAWEEIVSEFDAATNK